MSASIRTILILLLLFMAPVLTAQQTTTTATDTAPATETTPSRETTRDEFNELLHRSPDELAVVLVMEPALLTNDTFLAAHPELARFVAAHPEVRLEPSYYLTEWSYLKQRGGGFNNVLEPLMAFSGFVIVAYALAWVVRTLVEQKRWSRLAQTQSEVHNKILDRFGSSAELLDYIKTPAGTKFLESAPIAVHADRVSQNPPLARALGSIQIGLVLAAGAVGMLFVSSRYPDENGRGLYALGVIGLCIGAGFIISAAVSLLLSRRLGIWRADADEVEQVR